MDGLVELSVGDLMYPSSFLRSHQRQRRRRGRGRGVRKGGKGRGRKSGRGRKRGRRGRGGEEQEEEKKNEALTAPEQERIPQSKLSKVSKVRRHF